MKQRGAALLTALLVAAMAASLAGGMLLAASRDIDRATLLADRVQAERLVDGALLWVQSVVAADGRATTIDHLGEVWAQPLPPVPAERALISGTLTDAQGRFNLNNLAPGGKRDDTQITVFKSLLDSLRLAPELADALADWIDADQDGAFEDSAYLALTPPYRAANQPLSSVSELALVRGFDSKVQSALLPYVSALPTPGPKPLAININTAPAPVLATLLKIEKDAAAKLIAKRDANPWKNLGELRAALGSNDALAAPDDAIGFATQHFEARYRVSLGAVEFNGRALIARGAQGATSIIRVEPM